MDPITDRTPVDHRMLHHILKGFLRSTAYRTLIIDQLSLVRIGSMGEIYSYRAPVNTFLAETATNYPANHAPTTTDLVTLPAPLCSDQLNVHNYAEHFRSQVFGNGDLTHILAGLIDNFIPDLHAIHQAVEMIPMDRPVHYERLARKNPVALAIAVGHGPFLIDLLSFFYRSIGTESLLKYHEPLDWVTPRSRHFAQTLWLQLLTRDNDLQCDTGHSLFRPRQLKDAFYLLHQGVASHLAEQVLYGLAGLGHLKALIMVDRWLRDWAPDLVVLDRQDDRYYMSIILIAAFQGNQPKVFEYFLPQYGELKARGLEARLRILRWHAAARAVPIDAGKQWKCTPPCPRVNTGVIYFNQARRLVCLHYNLP
ncbi:hypothetical protein IWQ60_002151 [Tieghemiomyces parasiticus]|uniref:Uncharacterized protein n=1 Tax=Tieghemiomyces parasiticus TaxID=78921 RepID=A0A9W8AJZ1_9FUNG|nr:hypothetical protein IWQ60_002151 [Tieghemiomyces parasiticus]